MNSKKNNKKIKNFIEYLDRKIDIKKFIKFCITGTLNTMVHLLAFTVFNEILQIDPTIAQACAYTVATVNSYIINKNWTFNKKKGYNKSEMFKFALVNLLSLSLSSAGMYIFHKELGINEYICQIPIACITIMINYFGNKIFVFNASK